MSLHCPFSASRLSAGHALLILSSYGRFTQFANFGAVCLNDSMASMNDRSAFASLLRHYGKLMSLSDGRLLHARIIQSRYYRDLFLCNCVVEMYGNCGCLDDARAMFATLSNPNVYSWNILLKVYGQNGGLAEAMHVFDKMPYRDVVSWTAMIGVLAQNRHGKLALDLFRQMQLNNVKPNNISLVCALEACASLAALEEGQKIHVTVVQNGHEQDVFVATALITLYGKCKSVQSASNIFCSMTNRNLVSWTAMISAFAQNGYGKEALDLFYQMQIEGHRPNNITFISALDACANLAMLEEGHEIHAAIVNFGYGEDVLRDSLFSMYVKCESLCDSKYVFCRMPDRDVVHWTAMIATLTYNGYGREAVDYFHQMQLEGIDPDNIAFVCALDACAGVAGLEEGQEFHAAIISGGYEQDMVVENALINMYGKCGSALGAMNVFGRMSDRDVISWTAMIAAFTQNGQDNEALDLFYGMQSHGVVPNDFTLVCALDACSSLSALKHGQEIHGAIVDSEYEQHVVVTTALITMYGKCGQLQAAKNVFARMSSHDVVSWTAMIAVLAQNGDGKEALDLFQQMQHDGMVPNDITFICILAACSRTGFVDTGIGYFLSMNKDHGMSYTMDHYVCMIDLLGRAGHLDEAENLIIRIPFDPVSITWLCLLGACRIHGDVERAVHVANHCFELDPKNGAAYVMLSNIYAVAGCWNDVTAVREAFTQRGAKLSEGFYNDGISEIVHEFIKDVLNPHVEMDKLTIQEGGILM